LHVVLGVVLIAAAATAETRKPPRNAASWCDEHEGTAFTVNKDDNTWTPTDQLTEATPPRYTVAWRGKLDADKRTDVILNQGGCGTQECLHAAYVQCADKTYAEVMGPIYASRVRVRGTWKGWMNIHIEHVGEREDDGHRPRYWGYERISADGYGSK
jgi:hypothetical protein